MVVDTQSSLRGGSSVSKKIRVFEVNDEHQLLLLLNYVRRGPFQEDEKGDIRNVILDFATSKDARVLSSIIPTLEEKGIQLLTNKSTQSKEKEVTNKDLTEQTDPAKKSPKIATSPFGHTRLEPIFVTAKPSEVTSNTEERSKKIVINQTTTTKNIDTVLTKPTSELKKPNADVSKTAIPKNKEIEPTSQQATVVKSVPPIPDENSTPIELPQKKPLDRIKEIKKLVNEKIGNPINLLDIDNTIGKEYMNALLGAMKQINGGSHDELKLAMDRLEKAYAVVESSILSEKNTTKENTQSKIEEGRPDNVASEPKMSKPTVVPDALQPRPAMSNDTKPVTPKAIPIKEVPTDTPISTPTATQERTPLTDPPTSDNSPKPLTQNKKPLEEATGKPQTVPQQNNSTVTTAHSISENKNQITDQKITKPQSLAEKILLEKEKQTLINNKIIQEQIKNNPTENANDPLMTPEITAGLAQLLSEWKLFKSSGIFGMGPGGIAHPLYKTLAPLHMATVISGRFEGVTPEIRRSIDDYMKGWHYEQNIVHEMNETFEHFLRRVIQKILSKNKTGPTS